MLARAEKTVIIHRPVQSVFEFVLDGANNRLWKPSVLEVRPLGDAPYGAGTRFHQEVKGPEGPLPGDYEITELEQNKLIGIQVIEGPAHWRGQYEFQQQPSGTQLTYTLTHELGESDASRMQHDLAGKEHPLMEEKATSVRLSPPEQRALSMRLDGKPDEATARSLSVGEGSVRNYVFSALTKLALPRIQAWMDDEVNTLDELKAFLEKIA